MSKWQKFKKWAAEVGIGTLLTVLVCTIAINLSGNIKQGEQIDLLLDTNTLLQHRIDNLNHRLSNLNLEHEHELQEHNHNIDRKYKMALKGIEELIKIIRANGEYCTRKGDVGCRE